MSYRCGIGASLAAVVGLEPGGPRVKCDGSCGTIIPIDPRKQPPAWLFDGRPPKRGWKTVKHDDGTRSDWCPKCR